MEIVETCMTLPSTLDTHRILRILTVSLHNSSQRTMHDMSKQSKGIIFSKKNDLHIVFFSHKLKEKDLKNNFFQSINYVCDC